MENVVANKIPRSLPAEGVESTAGHMFFRASENGYSALESILRWSVNEPTYVSC